MRLYTGTGDKGTTSLASGKRISKSNSIFSAIGAVDELNSLVGFAASLSKIDAVVLGQIQADLFSIGAELAGAEKSFEEISEKNLKWLEEKTNQLGATLPQLKNFVLPGGTQYAAALHMCRTVCRRAERNVIALTEEKEEVNPQLKIYLNRLSSLFFGLALQENKRAGVKETEWRGK